jgi:zinc transporter ZupT
MRGLSLLPALYVVAALIYLAAGGATSWPLGVAHGAMVLVCVFVLVRSILHVHRNDRLSAEQRTMWTLLALFFGFVALPVYWFVIADREASAPSAA